MISTSSSSVYLIHLGFLDLTQECFVTVLEFLSLLPSNTFFSVEF